MSIVSWTGSYSLDAPDPLNPCVIATGSGPVVLKIGAKMVRGAMAFDKPYNFASSSAGFSQSASLTVYGTLDEIGAIDGLIGVPSSLEPSRGQFCDPADVRDPYGGAAPYVVSRFAAGSSA